MTRAGWKLALFALASMAILTATTTPLSAEKRMVRWFHYDDYWYYRGESLGGHTTPATQSGPFCGGSYCADGRGTLGTDYSWWYSGNFVAGLFDGSGTLTNDFFTYVGEFRRGEFHGYGTLKCLDGAYFEGTFAGGKMIGDFKLGPGPNAPVKRFDGLQVYVAASDPCEW